MSYEPRTYWESRAKAQGPHYVGPGGNTVKSILQARVFRHWIRRVRPDPPVHTVLDFGCGPGRLSNAIHRSGEHYIGVDLSKTAIKAARMVHHGKPNRQYSWLMGSEIPVKSGSVEMAFAVTVFQHIVADKDWKLWTGELRRVLKPGAPVFVIDAAHTGAPTDEHVKTRKVGVIAAALSREALTLGRTTEHWVGMLQ